MKVLITKEDSDFSTYLEINVRKKHHANTVRIYWFDESWERKADIDGSGSLASSGKT